MARIVLAAAALVASLAVHRTLLAQAPDTRAPSHRLLLTTVVWGDSLSDAIAGESRDLLQADSARLPFTVVGTGELRAARASGIGEFVDRPTREDLAQLARAMRADQVMQLDAWRSSDGVALTLLWFRAGLPAPDTLLRDTVASRSQAAAAVAARIRAVNFPAPRVPLPFLTQSGAWPIVGLHLGVPGGISVTSGVALGLGAETPGSLFADGEVGVTGIRYGVGYLVFDDQVAGLGAAVRVARLNAWSSTLGARRGLTYSGIEGTAMVLLLSVRFGHYVAHDHGTLVNLTTADVGIGF